MSGFTIKLSRFEFAVRAKEPIILHAYPGSTLRGAFGISLKKVVCALKNKECQDCILKEQCIYSYMFETPPPSDTTIMRKYLQIPRPFILEPPLERKIEYAPGEQMTFGLTLIGDRALACCPYFIYAFDELGKVGIGQGRGKFELEHVKCISNGMAHKNSDQSTAQTVYSSDTKTFKPVEGTGMFINWDDICSNGAPPNTLTLNFITPTRIYFNESLVTEPEFHIIIRSLQRRISLLSNFHCGIDISEWDFFNKIIDLAKGIKIKDRDIKWRFWERFSTRQQEWIEMSGFVGKATYEGKTDSFIPLLQAGELLHVGKGTTLGLGRYQLE